MKRKYKAQDRLLSNTHVLEFSERHQEAPVRTIPACKLKKKPILKTTLSNVCSDRLREWEELHITFKCSKLQGTSAIQAQPSTICLATSCTAADYKKGTQMTSVSLT